MLKIENIKFNQMDFNQLYAWCIKYQKEHSYPPMVTFLHFSNDLYSSPYFCLRDRIISITHLNDVTRGVEEVRKMVIDGAGNCKIMPMHVSDYLSDMTTEIVGWLGSDEFVRQMTELLFRNNPDFDYKLKKDIPFVTCCKSGLKLSERNCTTIVRGEDGRLTEVVRLKEVCNE